MTGSCTGRCCAGLYSLILGPLIATPHHVWSGVGAEDLALTVAGVLAWRAQVRGQVTRSPGRVSAACDPRRSGRAASRADSAARRTAAAAAAW